MAKKIYTKKLTYAGMSLCLLSFFAFILSAAGALADPVGKLIYNNVFTNKIDFMFTPDIFAYVNIYGLSCALVIFSLVVFFTCARAKGKKKLDGAFAGFLILFPLVVMITKGVMIYYVLVKGHFSNAITMGYDNDKFRVALSLADDVLPFIAAFLLFIGGLVIAGRLMGEDFAVEIPVAAKAPENTPAPIPMAMPQEQSFAQPDMSQFRKPDNAEPVMSQSVTEPEQAEPTEAPTDTADVTEQPVWQTTPEKCPHCGSDLKSGAKFCSVCGNKV